MEHPPLYLHVEEMENGRYVKKNQVFLMTIIIISILSGCNNERNITGNQINNSEKLEAYYMFTENSDQPYWNRSQIKKVNEGYYYFYNEVLHFFDTASRTSFLVCSLPDCGHANETCNANFNNYGTDFSKGFLTIGLEISKNHIYVVGYEQSEVTDFYLYRISRDGTKRERLFYLHSTDLEHYGYQYTMHKNYLYSFIFNEDDKSYLERISLDNKKENIFDVANYYGVCIDTIAGYGDYVYFDAVWYEDEEKTKLISRLYRLDVETNELEVVMDDFICNRYQLVDDTNIIYMDLGYNILFKNIKTGEEKIVRPTTGNYGEFSYDGRYLLTKILDEEFIEAYDLDGNKVDTIEVNGGNCLFGDSEYLFMEGMEPLAGVSNAPDFGFYALPKDQIGSKNKNWILLGE